MEWKVVVVGSHQGTNIHTEPHPTPPNPPHPKFHLLGVSIYLFGHGLAAAAPGHGQVALGTKKVADPGTQRWGGVGTRRPEADIGVGWGGLDLH